MLIRNFGCEGLGCCVCLGIVVSAPLMLHVDKADSQDKYFFKLRDDVTQKLCQKLKLLRSEKTIFESIRKIPILSTSQNWGF